MPNEKQTAAMPRSWRLLFLLFATIGRRRLRKSFRAVRILHPERLQSLPAGPVVVYLNHPSWWDPIVCAEVSRRLLPGRKHRAPISAESLKQYRFFRHIGMFPVEQDSPRGAAEFLRRASTVLAGDGVLWITAQGHFTDPRVRPVQLKAGLGALLHRSSGVTVIPMAVEYTFWNQRLPEVLLAAGEPFTVGNARERSSAAWTVELQDRLQAAQEQLSAASCQRQDAAFVTLLQGRKGTGGPYALWQRVRARLRGETFEADHRDGRPAPLTDAARALQDVR